MKTTKDVYDRVSVWNSKRYDRTYNYELLVSLLEEEIQEFYDSNSKLERIDAVCDTMYVALGGLWKLQITDIEIAECFVGCSSVIPDIVECSPYPPIMYVRTFIDAIKYGSESGAEVSVTLIVQACMYQLSSMLGSTELAYEAMEAVCDSNDSKSIVRVPSNEKANGIDKGDYYVPPTVKLNAIIGKSHVNHH